MRKILSFIIPTLGLSALSITSLSGVALAMSAVPPATIPGAGVFAGYGSGYAHVLGTTAANTTLLSFGGTIVPTYCIDITKKLDTSATAGYTPGTASGISNLGLATDIAVHGSTIGTPITPANSESAAEQLAIWKLTNNTNYATVANTAIVNRANQLVADAKTPLNVSSTSPTLTASVSAPSNTTATINLDLVQGATPVANATIKIASPTGTTTVTTNGAGVASINEPRGTTAAKYTFTYNYAIPAGTVLTTTLAGSQPLVSINSAPSFTTASATIPTAAPVATTTTVAPTTTLAPTTTVAPTTTLAPTTTVAPATTITTPTTQTPATTVPNTTPTTIAKQLPYTGSWVSPTLIWGFVVMLASAAGALIIKIRQN